MKRQKIAAGNWKMNLSIKEGLDLTDKIVKNDRPNNVLTILAAPFTHLQAVHEHVRYMDNVEIAAQNCHQELSGAFTGEISAKMITSMGINYVVLGHSERRQYYNESNELLKAKLDVCLKEGLKVIFCCGESLKTRKAKKHEAFVKNQLKESLFHLTKKQLANVVIAYEPIWAIGTGETASPEQAQEMHFAIRNTFKDKYGAAAKSISILYGGSVKPANAKELFAKPDIDGGLVGGASLKADSFVDIIRSF